MYSRHQIILAICPILIWAMTNWWTGREESLHFVAKRNVLQNIENLAISFSTVPYFSGAWKYEIYQGSAVIFVGDWLGSTVFFFSLQVDSTAVRLSKLLVGGALLCASMKKSQTANCWWEALRLQMKAKGCLCLVEELHSRAIDWKHCSYLAIFIFLKLNPVRTKRSSSSSLSKKKGYSTPFSIVSLAGSFFLKKKN